MIVTVALAGLLTLGLVAVDVAVALRQRRRLKEDLERYEREDM